jgi:hypothetical protein
MKIKYQVLMLIFVITSLSCKNEKVEIKNGLSNAISLTKEEKQLEALGQKYFRVWTATQAVGATEIDIENYLDLLLDDVGHQHYPYDNDDSRMPDSKESIRKGMRYYLAVHTEYKATLISISVGHDVIMIKYRSSSKGIHPQTQKEINSTKNTVEVLEVEKGKISMIRKYRE